MKKNIAKFLSMSLIAAVLPICTVAYAKDNSGNEKIKEVLTNYFTNELNMKSELETIPNKYILPGSELEDYDKLKSELTVNWLRGINQQVDTYSENVKINKIETNGDSIKIDVNNNVSLKYKDSEVETKYTDNHIVSLKTTENNDLLVEYDIFEPDTNAKTIESKVANTEEKCKEYIEQKIENVNEKMNSLNGDIDKFNKDSKKLAAQRNISARSYSSYNGDSAASWAINNAYSSEDYSGNDCTNFVSKALKAGGLPTDSTWSNGSNAWIRVTELRNWLKNKGYATEYSSLYTCKKGDIVQLYNKDKGNWSHSLMITYIGGYGTVYVSAHSNAAQNKPLFQYYPENSTYSNIRYLKVTA
ncbi:putative amidase domain protein [Clostridium puniceum]|uniref:Putative amidase domain protein n=1 Tax=Clostridium puniceum TaxID=29367 RepID=A0A1S8TT46_9CLOT|nr:amidase domain-containing protein [Clostridium puniceum]OOM80861.1 putative amidase domain protein [Clostridium puniceum]